MSATATEPVSVPLYLQVAGAILRLASDLFSQQDMRREPEFNAWKTLRRTTRLLCERYALQLTLNEAYELREALKFCRRDDDHDFLLKQEFTERG